jgi:hypothetical protein
LKLFIDDERVPSDVGLINKEWVIVRTYDQAILMLANLQVFEISFDHDLADFSGEDGKELTGYDIAKWIVTADSYIVATEINRVYIGCFQHMLDSIKGEIITKDFKFNVHSANVVGKKNIESLMNNYIKHKFG